MNPFTPSVLAVAYREFMQRVKTKWFILGTIGMPVIMVGVAFLIVFAMRDVEDSEKGKTIGVVDSGGTVANLLVEELNDGSVTASRARDLEDLPPDVIRERFLSTAFDYLLILPDAAATSARGAPFASREETDDTEDRVTATLLARDKVPSGTRRSARNALQRALLQTRLQAAGVEAVDARELLRRPRLNAVNVTDTGETRSQTIQSIASMGIVYLYFTLLLAYGQMVLMSTIEDKQSNIVEILASSLRPWELMLGKILGCGAMALAQLGIWALMAATAVGFFLTRRGLASVPSPGPALGGGRDPITGETADLSVIDLISDSISWESVILALLYFVLGYLLYTSVFAAAGATVSDLQDAQQAMTPIVLVIMVSLIAGPLLMESPNNRWVVILSMVPPFNAVVMPARVFSTEVPFWQWGLSLILLAAAVATIVWLAGRIYRVGILMRGQRASLPEIVRWVRHG
ncbi:MAG: ABC transporter permease [Candidatus Aminicenantes bacterium]|nr:ABC transporter permease [Candidatus Aminicenantes bacterium]